MVEVEGGGKHSDEFEFEFESRVAAIERVGRGIGDRSRRRWWRRRRS